MLNPPRPVPRLFACSIRAARAARVVGATLAFVAGLSAAWADAKPGADARVAFLLPDQHRVLVTDLDGRALASVPTGVAPRAAALHEGRLFVANRGSARAPASSVTLIDLEGLRAERTIYACEGCGPRAIAFTNEGTLVLSGESHRALVFLEPPYDAPSDSLVLAGGLPAEVGAFPSSPRVVSGSIGGRGVFVVDLEGRGVTRLEFDEEPHAVAQRPGSDEIWVAARGGGVTALNATTFAEEGGELDTFPGLEGALDLAFSSDGRLALIAGRDGTLMAIDADSREQRGRVELERPLLALAPSSHDPGLVVVATHEPPRALLVRVEEGGRKLSLLREWPLPGPVSKALFLP